MSESVWLFLHIDEMNMKDNMQIFDNILQIAGESLYMFIVTRNYSAQHAISAVKYLKYPSFYSSST